MQEFFKNLIIAVSDAGLSQIVYYGFQVLTFVIVFFVAIWLAKKMNIRVVKAILTVVIIYPVMDIWKRVLYWLETGVFGGENNVRIFVYVPIMAILVGLLLKIDKKKICDFVAPLMVLTQGVGHFGCIFTGCCQGYPALWGLYNLHKNAYLFPIQPIEAISALLIAVYLIWRMKNRNFMADGLSYPIMLMLFGFSRFIWEFFRDNEKIWLNCSALAFHALFMGIVGLIAFVIIKHKNNSSKQMLKTIH